MKRYRPFAARSAAPLALLLLLASACGGAAAPPNAPSAESAGAAAVAPAAALADLDSAERAVELALGPSVAGGFAQPPAQAAAAPPSPPSPPPPPPPPAPSMAPFSPSLPPPPPRTSAGPKKGGGDFREAPGQGVGAEPCGTACTALASMERAAEHVCGITGAADERCAAARVRVKSASARVHAQCPACGS